MNEQKLQETKQEVIGMIDKVGSGDIVVIMTKEGEQEKGCHLFLNGNKFTNYHTLLEASKELLTQIIKDIIKDGPGTLDTKAEVIKSLILMSTPDPDIDYFDDDQADALKKAFKLEEDD